MRVRVSSPALRKHDGWYPWPISAAGTQLLFFRRRSQVGKARVCKTPITGSSPVVASRSTKHPGFAGCFALITGSGHAVGCALPWSPHEVPNTPVLRGVLFNFMIYLSKQVQNICEASSSPNQGVFGERKLASQVWGKIRLASFAFPNNGCFLLTSYPCAFLGWVVKYRYRLVGRYPWRNGNRFGQPTTRGGNP